MILVIKMKAIFLLIMQIWTAGAEFCSQELRMKFEGNFSVQGNNIEHNGVIYPEGAHWSERNETFGCPCQLKDRPCISLCSKGEAEAINLTVPDAEFEFEVWHGESIKTVKLPEHFIPKENLGCALIGYNLEIVEGASYKILNNGSIHVKFSHDENHFFGPSEFCIMNNQSEVVIYVCENEEAHAGEGHADDNYLRAYLYSALMLVSVVFLLLTLVAFFFAPEMHNLHGKSIACQSASLMVAFAALAFTMLTHIIEISGATCKIIAYISYFFLMNSFFWLNTMCFDIYWTFSGNRQLFGASPAKKFMFYAIYSTTASLALIVVMAIMDNVLDKSSNLWPGIGENKCWFANRWAEFAFYHGPNSLLIIANGMFFILTIVKIIKVKKETAVLHSAGSKAHNCAHEDKQRLSLYLKLFLLMGGMWMLEVISWIAKGEPKELWIVTDSINCLRGVMIFYFLVWSNKKVRRSLLSRISDKYASSSQTERSLSSKASALSDSPQHDADASPVDDDNVL